ncbi:MAG: hypothetical protein DMF28_07575, partial [Verrucomicrobia bacterium]
GAGALLSNADGGSNTANGASALQTNTAGTSNTATGASTLFSNTNGNGNTANGTFALQNSTTGGANTASGVAALRFNIDGDFNTASGFNSLQSNTHGSQNTASGNNSLQNSTTGIQNTATGDDALQNNTGGNENTALGFKAGLNATTGAGNVYIGSQVIGVAGESNHTYIRNINTTTVSGGGTDTVTVNLTTGLLGHLSSSRRYKEDIKSMDKASEALYRLKPATYRYKKEIDTTQSLDYGLIAEDVAQVDPNLAIRNGKGEIESVRYNAVNAMLLNEFLKEHRKVEELETTMTRLTATVERQAAQIKKVSAQIEVGKPAPQIVVNAP